jgi:rhodanese-related sulfurtransferase
MDHSPGFLAVVASRRAGVVEMSVAEARSALAGLADARLLDVREDHEWNAGHAAGAEHLARGILERDIERRVPQTDTPLFLYCGGGYRSILASATLHEMGYTNVVSVQGGWRAWEESGAPVERPHTAAAEHADGH